MSLYLCILGASLVSSGAGHVAHSLGCLKQKIEIALILSHEPISACCLLHPLTATHINSNGKVVEIIHAPLGSLGCDLL